MGLDTKTYWLIDRQSQCNFDFDFDFDNELVVRIERASGDGKKGVRLWKEDFMCAAVLQWDCYTRSSCATIRYQEITSGDGKKCMCNSEL
jgi:hypothetical protein